MWWFCSIQLEGGNPSKVELVANNVFVLDFRANIVFIVNGGFELDGVYIGGGDCYL